MKQCLFNRIFFCLALLLTKQAAAQAVEVNPVVISGIMHGGSAKDSILFHMTSVNRLNPMALNDTLYYFSLHPASAIKDIHGVLRYYPFRHSKQKVVFRIPLNPDWNYRGPHGEILTNIALAYWPRTGKITWISPEGNTVAYIHKNSKPEAALFLLQALATELFP